MLRYVGLLPFILFRIHRDLAGFVADKSFFFEGFDIAPDGLDADPEPFGELFPGVPEAEFPSVSFFLVTIAQIQQHLVVA